MLSATGGLLGVAFGVPLRRDRPIAGWGLNVSPRTVALAVGFSLAVGVVFGVWPARQAARSTRSPRCATSRGGTGASIRRRAPVEPAGPGSRARRAAPGTPVERSHAVRTAFLWAFTGRRGHEIGESIPRAGAASDQNGASEPTHDHERCGIRRGRRRAAASRAPAGPRALPRAWRSVREPRCRRALLAGSAVLLLCDVAPPPRGRHPRRPVGLDRSGSRRLPGTWAALVGGSCSPHGHPWLDQVVGTDRLRHRSTAGPASRPCGCSPSTAPRRFSRSPVIRSSSTPGELLRLLLTVPGDAGRPGVDGPVRARGGHLDAHGPPADLVQGARTGPPVRLPRGRLRVPAPAHDKERLVSDPLARAVCIGMYLVAFVPLLAYRVIEYKYLNGTEEQDRTRPRIA